MAVVYSKVLLFDPPLIYTAPDICVFGAVTAPERKKKGKVSSLRETSNQDTETSQSEERDKLNPYRLTYGELSEDEPERLEYIELIEGDEDIEIIRPGRSKNNETQIQCDTVQTQDPEINQKKQESQNPRNEQETEDPEEVEGDHEINSEQESEPESCQESDPESEPKLSESLSEEEPISLSESDNDGGMAQPPPPPPTVERGPSIRLPWFSGKEDEQVEKYFRELKRLKAIYKWQDDHLLNMSLLGLKGRADDWASAIADADKDTFTKLEEAMKIFRDKRAQWQKHADFSNLKQLKEKSVIDFAGILK